MKIEKVVVGELETNCYIIAESRHSANSRLSGRGSAEAGSVRGNGQNYVIIDPGADGAKILEKISVMNRVPSGRATVILTHAHPDHIGAVGEISGELKCKICLHNLDSEWLKQMLGSSFPGLRNVEDSEIIKVGSLNFKVIHTPGHTPGSICLYLEKENVVFTGDTLFAQGVGRTDLPCGNEQALQNSLKKLFVLPDSVKVYPGHGPETTIENEKEASED